MTDYREYIITAIKAQQGKNVIGATTYISKSGISSRIRCWIITEDTTRQEITMELKGSKNHNGLFVSGYGTDPVLLSLYVFYQTFTDSRTALHWANNYQRITY